MTKPVRRASGSAYPTLTDGAGTAACSRSRFCDQLALYLAESFHRDELPFSFCDWIMTYIFSVMVLSDEGVPNLTWRIFIAFDEGEYHHSQDPNEDPISSYTRPMIAEILNTVGDI